jgi:uncharacterized membrane protein
MRSLPAFPLAATIGYTFSVYASLPARIATHWGIDGQANGWAPREFGAWLLPGMMVFVWGLCTVLPWLNRRNADKFGAAYSLVVTAILSFEGVIQWAMLNVALGHPVNITTIAYVGVGALFALVGLALQKAPGFLMATAGLFTIVGALEARPQIAFVVMVTSTLAAGVGSVLLSLWRRR